jgi:hypothetical protein
MKLHHLRRLGPAAGLAVLLATAPQPASAAVLAELPAGLGCPDFALRIDANGGNLHTQTIQDRNGNPVRIITAGKGVVLTYTNLGPDLDNPVELRAVTIRTDGSVSQTTFNRDGTQTVVATGHNGLILFPTDIPAGPTTTHYIGRIVYTVDPATGVFTLISTSGSKRDICAEVAS